MGADDPLASYLNDFRSAPSKKCHVCNDKQARENLARLYELKETEDPSVTGMTLTRFRDEFLVARLGLSVSIHSCSRHVKECLRRDVLTGKQR